ncbi:hypothetical protein [Mammaliicoccus fleurettii]|nr:hypothetical protein [Mammaliicoccus fleurettii]
MAFFTFGLGKTHREALDRRWAMENPEDYMGNTLRENMNIDYQLGLGPRILNESE